MYSGDFTEADGIAIKARCDEDPDFRERFVEAHQLLGALDDWGDEFGQDSMYRSSLARPRAARRPVSVAVASGLAAGVLVAIGIWLAWTAVFVDRADTATHHTTQVGEQRILTLADGSVITLNTDTQVLVGMTDSARRVVMDRGEAYFEVAQADLRPFTVEVGGRSLTAHGTEFNVHRHRDGFAVALIDGRLAVYRQGREPPANPTWLDPAGHSNGIVSTVAEDVGLLAGTVLDFDARSQRALARHDPDIARRQQWRQGRLSFRDEPLSVVVAELNRYADKRLRIRDTHVGDIRVFATLRLDSIDAALRTLEQTVPIRVVPTSTEVLISADDEGSEPSPR